MLKYGLQSEKLFLQQCRIKLKSDLVRNNNNQGKFFSASYFDMALKEVIMKALNKPNKVIMSLRGASDKTRQYDITGKV